MIFFISINKYFQYPFKVLYGDLFGLDAIHTSSVSHGVSHLRFSCLDLSCITQGQNIDQCNQALSIPKKKKRVGGIFPLLATLSLTIRKQERAKPLFESSRNWIEMGPLASRNVIYMGNLQEDTCSFRGHCLRAPEGQPRGSGFLLGKGANRHSTGRDRELCLWEKDSQ